MSFPEGFFWGAATSAHQVEGANRGNDWWEAEVAGRLPFASGEACRHRELYEADLDLARGLHHNAYRFSVEWSRVQPEPDRFDGAALEHYRSVVRACRARGLEPFVTLHHFTNPLWFARGGGWLAGDAPRVFARYVERVARALADVRHWITINEPTVATVHGYVLGEWPPFERRAWWRARKVLRHMARAHALACRALRRTSEGALVGYAHSAPWIVPCDPDRGRDRLAARLRDLAWNGLFPRWVAAQGGRGERLLDFLGLNYYTRTLTRSQGPGSGLLLGRACRAAHHADLGPESAVGTEVFPPGLALVLERFASLEVPLVVTENGVATDDEELRTATLHGHLAALARALARGAPVRGYLYWSLLDNFEWRHGTNARYGLAAVDFATQERTLRPAAHAFARVCRANALR